MVTADRVAFARLLATLDAARQPTDNPADSGLREALDELRRFSEAHHDQQDPAVLAHALAVDIPHRIDLIRDRLAATERKGPE